LHLEEVGDVVRNLLIIAGVSLKLRRAP
jgi:hypothetical protein